ncbi:Peptide transporter PTR2 [Hordeum vulgare]|nr:Peptide transporter PTR2 [Hordeum vulgare]
MLSRVFCLGLLPLANISPVISHLILHGVSHLQYADDTIIMVELNDSCLAHIKFVLLCFEAPSGLKINFAKSEVIITRVDDGEAMRMAHLLHCSMGSFPFKYLGLPIAPDKICAKEFAPIVTKVGNRVLPWSGRYNTNSELAGDNWGLAFRRALFPEELVQWHHLAALFPSLS